MNSAEDDDRQFPLTVKLTAMSDQTRAQIEYYIERSNNRHFALADDFVRPDVVIIDYEHPGTTDRLEAEEWQTDITLVILSAGNRRIDGAIFVTKPLNSAGLEDAAVIALQKLNGHFVAAPTSQHPRKQDVVSADNNLGLKNSAQASEPPASLSSSSDSYVADNPETPAYFRTSDAALPGPPSLPMLMRIQRYRDKIDLLCGLPRTLEQLSDPHNAEHRYDPHRCLSQRVAQFVFTPDPDIKAVHIKLPEAEVYVLPTLNKVYTSLSLEYKRNVKRLFSDWDDIDVQVLAYNNDNVNQVIDTLNQSTRYSFSSQSFCWLSTLFGSQGRLPFGMDVNTPCKILHWPNITRLELIPDSLEIAAAWTGNLVSLPQIIERVRCEPRHAVSFLNAARTIRLMVDANDQEL